MQHVGARIYAIEKINGLKPIQHNQENRFNPVQTNGE